MTFPVAPAPRTWSPADIISTPRLRADPGNLAWLLTRRPMFCGFQVTTGQSIPSAALTAVQMDTEGNDNWSGHTNPNAAYSPQLAGYYLSEGSVSYSGTGTGGQFQAGIKSEQNAVATYVSNQTLSSNGHNAPVAAAADLQPYNPVTADAVALYAYQASGAAVTLAAASLQAQWAGLSSGGTVVTSPQPAALWPAGGGTSVTNAGGIAAGATSVTVASATGIVTGGTLGLDYYEGAAVQAWAETVTVTSVSGTTIGITAAAYPHLQNAPVAVPVSAAFMNQQVRDVISFLAYPPMLRLPGLNTTQTLPTQVFPAATPITWPTAAAGATFLDNFSGWGGSGSSTYTFPVSGVYYVYGQVPIAGTAAYANLSAGLAVAGGTIQWGDSVRSQSAYPGCATVRKRLRVTAGQTLQLYGSQDSGASQALSVTSGSPLLLAVWQGF